MSETGSKSPFDLEEEKGSPSASSELLGEAAAAPTPTPMRAPRERSKRRRERAPKAPDGVGSSGSRVGAFFSGLFTSPRWFYALTSVMSAVLLFILYNPSFGMQSGVWFWEALQGKGDSYAHGWNPTILQAVVIPLFTLAFAAAAISGERRSRSLWAAAWVLLAFVTFQISRDELRYFLPPILAAAALGLVIRRAQGGRASQTTWIILIILGALLWMPLPLAKADDKAGFEKDPTGYRCAAVGLIDLLIEAPGEPDDGALTRRAKLMLLELPQYTTLLAFILLVLSLALSVWGVRARWLGYAAGGLLFVFLIGFTWMQYDIGSARGENPGATVPAWWRAARQIGDAWRARFLIFLPALVAVFAELGRPAPEDN